MCKMVACQSSSDFSCRLELLICRRRAARMQQFLHAQHGEYTTPVMQSLFSMLSLLGHYDTLMCRCLTHAPQRSGNELMGCHMQIHAVGTVGSSVALPAALNELLRYRLRDGVSFCSWFWCPRWQPSGCLVTSPARCAIADQAITKTSCECTAK